MELYCEQHQIKRNHKFFNECKIICHLSKNLYNATLYEVRQYFFETNKYLNYCKVNKKFTDENQVDYRALPTKVAKSIQMKLDKNFKSFFNLNKKYKSGNYKNKPNIPKYLDKDGYYVTEYTKQALSLIEDGYIKLSKTNIKIKTNINKKSIQAVRIVPKNGYFVIEILYRVEHKQLKQNDRYASIDLGLNNLVTLTGTNIKPTIINGKPLKSINQYYNKIVSKYKSLLDIINKQKTSKRIQNISRKRKNKVIDYLHKASAYIVNQLVSNDISTLIVGYNKNWKQDINIGKINNQNFVNIPYYIFVNMLKYKCKHNGINVIIQEESYTSKCSFIDKESIEKHDNYVGKRLYRGLFISKNGTKINADVNGSLNILRKYFIKNVAKNDIYNYINLVEACSTPNVITMLIA